MIDLADQQRCGIGGNSRIGLPQLDRAIARGLKQPFAGAASTGTTGLHHGHGIGCPPPEANNVTNRLMSPNPLAPPYCPSPLTSAFSGEQLGYRVSHTGQLDNANTNGLMSAKLIQTSQFRSPRHICGPAAATDQKPPTSVKLPPVITSLPYPNRHDYTRVFGVELMFGFFDWDGTRELRYQLLHSHPEAKPDRPPADGYEEPAFITRAIRQVAKHQERERIVAMLHGYFLDLFLSLREVARALKPGGRAAFVLGNAQYDGVPIEVDKATALIGAQAGLTCTEIRVVRERGNSAQQMKDHGRNPSRESVVLFRRKG